MARRFNLASILVVAVATVQGCAVVAVGEQSFFCERPENKDKTVCSGVQTVYRATSGTTERIRRNDVRPGASAAATITAETPKQHDDAVVHVPAITASSSPLPQPAGTIVHLPPPVDIPKPLLEPASVLRIWVNYWIDGAGDLHQPGLIYTEITPRRWSIGAVASPPIRTIQPLQVLSGNAAVNSHNSQSNDADATEATTLLPPATPIAVPNGVGSPSANRGGRR